MNITEEKSIWDKLLSCKRLSELKLETQEASCRAEPRNPFERDCDRITYSYPFRRLQDKTQVIPLPVVDFVHTRLTHTLEVATVGRSLGRLLEKFLLDKGVIDQTMCGDIPAIVTASCLAHDIGNPPFGHSGENSISEFFNYGDGGNYLAETYNCIENEITNKDGSVDINTTYDDLKSRIKCTDLKRFEGNANGFRILTNHNGTGLNLTAATLGAFTKYPRTSHIDGETDNSNWAPQRVSQKKYGIFYTERTEFKLVAEECGLKKLISCDGDCLSYARHPLAFLMESADDICYRIIDLEDGHRIGRIPFSEAEPILMKISSKDERFDASTYNKLSNEKLKVAYLRSRCINYLVFQCFEVFKEKYFEILNSIFDQELLDNIEDHEALEATKELKALVKKYIYKWHDVLTLEATGFEVLSGLIAEFVSASNYCIECPPSTQSKRAMKIYDLLPDQYCHISDTEERYERYMKVVDYTSGMSDSFALNLYKQIRGMYK